MRYRRSFPYLDTVTILRGVACLIIVTIHAPLPVSLIHAPIGIAITSIGFIGIYGFFFLSGFILGKRYLENKYTVSGKGILLFYWKRFKKIAPLYYLVLLYVFILTPPSVPDRTLELIRLLTFTAPEKLHLYSSGYLWFISTIMQLYLAAPLGFIALKFINKQTVRFRICLFALILLIGAVIRSLLLPSSSYEFISQSWVLNMYIFLGGMVLASFRGNVSISRLWRGGIIFFITIAFYFSFANVVSLGTQTSRLMYQIIIIPSVSFLLTSLILVSFPDKKSAENLSKAPSSAVVFFPLFFIFQIIGIFSYEIYLLHQPIFTRLNLPCFWQCTPLIFMTNIAVVTAISLVSAAGLRLVTKLAKRN